MQDEPLTFGEVKIGELFGKENILYRKESEDSAVVVRWENLQVPAERVCRPFDRSDSVTAFKDHW